MSDSIQHKLDRVRPPRVQITYDVEIGGAKTMKELPLVVGILADLMGQQEEPPAKVKERKFVQIDRDNFNDVLASLKPRLKLSVENKLNAAKDPNASKLSAELKFKHLDDFHPEKLVQQVEPLRKLLEMRTRLVDLLAKLDGNDDLNALLQDAMKDSAGLAEVKAALDKLATEKPSA